MATAEINNNNAAQAPEPETFWVRPLEPIHEQTIALPAPDQIGIAVIQPLVICSKTTEEFEEARFIEAVKLAASATVWEIPILAGSVVFEDKTCKRITCRIPDDPMIQVRIKRLQKDAHEMDAAHWPPHMFPHGEICLAERPTFGIGTYNFGVQANLIKGGVMLVLHMNHTILDGSAHANLVSVYTHHMAAALDGKPVTKSGLMTAEALNKSTTYGTHPARPILEWKDWRKAPKNTMSAEAASAAHLARIQKLTLTIWYMSSENQAKLRAAIQDPTKERLSFATCLSTWLWKSVMRARGLPPNTVSKMLTPIQARGRVKEVHKNYSGSALVYGHAKATVAELCSVPVQELGQRISRSVAWWTSDLIREYWGSIEDHVSKESISTIQPNTDRDFGTDVEVTNQTNFAFYKNSFGRGLEVRAWRLPGIAFTDGWVVVLPRMADGGQELLMYMSRDTLEKLIKDAEFREYVDYWCASDANADDQVK